jgi:hypothetical protein
VPRRADAVHACALDATSAPILRITVADVVPLTLYCQAYVCWRARQLHWPRTR